MQEPRTLRLEPADLVFCRIANRNHASLKALRHSERIQERIYKIAKKMLAFAGCLLFLLCLWMLA